MREMLPLPGLDKSSAIGTRIGPQGSSVRVDFLELRSGEMPNPLALSSIIVGAAHGRPYRLHWHGVGERPHVIDMDRGIYNVTAPGHETRLSWPHGADVAIIQIDPGYVAEVIDVPVDQLRIRTSTGTRSAVMRELVIAWQERARLGWTGPWHAEALAHRLALHLAITNGHVPRVDGDRGALDARRLRRVLEFVDAHLASDLTLQDMAAIAGLARCHFVGCFRRATGITPYAYVRRARLGLARERLRRPDATVADVARMVGFIGPSHFANAFRSEFGISPRAWRASQVDIDAGAWTSAADHAGETEGV